MKARNKTAEQLIATLDAIGVEYKAGYFCGSTYCIGVSLKGVDAAFQLGQQVKDYKGVLGVDVIGTRTVLAFRDALVSL